MKLYIKNMVCPRCIMVIERELKELEFTPVSIELGFVEFEHSLSNTDIESIDKKISPLGFEILNDNKKKQVEEIKNILIQALQDNNLEGHFSVKRYLSSKICKEYSLLSKLFSEKEGITIEHYFILLKLEKVKELISYGELTLNEIAINLGYSSVQHLSSQFKKTLGISTREYKNSIKSKRHSLDQVSPNPIKV